MKLAIMQPYLFPYIGYFQLMHAADKFVMYDDVTFIKQGWINRNNILVNNGPHLFSVPVTKISSNTRICETGIAGPATWKPKLLKTFQLAYSKAPHYEVVFDLLEDILKTDALSISGLAIESTEQICRYLGIKTPIKHSASGYNNRELNGQERVIDICKKERADAYINPIGGLELYDREIFREAGIELNFIKSKPIEYKQFNAKFVPWLSIIDVMMFNSPVEIDGLLNQYELI
jgi:hypothetical protein